MQFVHFSIDSSLAEREERERESQVSSLLYNANTSQIYQSLCEEKDDLFKKKNLGKLPVLPNQLLANDFAFSLCSL